MSRGLAALTIAVALAAAIAGASAGGGAGPTLVTTVAVGTHPVGVAVNAETNRIYVANDNSLSVSVVDGATNTVVAAIPVGGNPFFVAVNSRTNRVYVTGYGGVTVIDGATNEVVAKVAIVGASRYDGVAVNEETNRVYAAANGQLAVLDGATNEVVATIPNECGGIENDYRCYVAVNPSTNRVYAPPLVVDGATNEVVGMILGRGAGPLAVNPVTNRIYALRPGAVVDGASNATLATLPVGGAGIAVNPQTNRVYVASYRLSVVDGVTNEVVGSLDGVAPPGVSSFLGVATNPRTQRVYVTSGVAQQRGTLTVVADETGGGGGDGSGGGGGEEVDTEAPTVRALASSGRRRTLVSLRWRVSDDSGEARERIEVFRRSRRLAVRTTALGPREPGETYFVTWRAPRSPATLRFCVRAFDAAGNASARRCAELWIR